MLSLALKILVSLMAQSSIGWNICGISTPFFFIVVSSNPSHTMSSLVWRWSNSSKDASSVTISQRMTPSCVHIRLFLRRLSGNWLLWTGGSAQSVVRRCLVGVVVAVDGVTWEGWGYASVVLVRCGDAIPMTLTRLALVERLLSSLSTQNVNFPTILEATSMAQKSLSMKAKSSGLKDRRRCFSDIIITFSQCRWTLQRWLECRSVCREHLRFPHERSAWTVSYVAGFDTWEDS